VTLVRLLVLVLGLSHLRGCAVPLCDAVGGYPVTTVSTRTGDQRFSSAILTAGGELVIETGMSYLPPQYLTTVVRMDERYGPEEVGKFELVDEFGSGLVRAGDDWWFSLGGKRADRTAGIYFVTPEASFVEIPEVFDAVWLPLDGAEPRGLLVGMGKGGGRALEITRGGVVRRWPLPPINLWGYNLWAAERLPDGAIALFAVDRDHRVVLRVLDGGASAEETVLIDDGDAAHVTTALAPEGMVAVVVRRRAGLFAALFDPRNPAAIRWHQLTEKDESGAFPAVVVHEGKAIVGWSTSDRIRARAFTSERLAGPAATIGPLLRRGERRPSLAVLPDGEELLFLWGEDEVTTRRVPAELAGFALLESLCDRFLE